MEIIRNDNYHYTVTYIRKSNGQEYRIEAHRVTNYGGAVWDTVNKKCIKSNFEFAGWNIEVFRIIRNSEGKFEEKKRQKWPRKDGSWFNTWHVKDKKAAVKWIEDYIDE
jgi:hypothetical protein